MLFSSRRQLEAIVRHDGRILARTLLRRGRYVVGQDRKNEIVLDQDSISGRHARLTVISEAEMYVEDCGSANGTIVNGKFAKEATPITVDCKIELGQCTLEFQRGGVPAGVFPHMPEGFLRAHPYNLGEVVVQGRTSTIFEAHDTSLNRNVALKVMLPESQSSTPLVLRFIREAQITSQLQHPNIPPIYELRVDEQTQLFYTTRFVEGDTLGSIFERLAGHDPETLQRFPLPGLLSIFQKMCDALAFAHAHGVIHTALRPENITIGEFGEVFVMGWMFAELLPEPAPGNGSNGRTRVHAPSANGAAALSPYSDPRQAAGAAQGIDEQTDLYALGGILYKMITFRDPVIAHDETQLVSRILAGQIAAPTALARTPCPHWPGGHLPEYLAAVAIRALSMESTERPASVLELQRWVALWQEGQMAGAETGGARNNFDSPAGKR